MKLGAVGLPRDIPGAVGSSLKLKLVLLIVSILGLTIGIAPWSAIKMQEYQLLQAYEGRLRALHEMLRKTVVDTCMVTGNGESVQRVLEAVSTHQNIEDVRIFDTSGVVQYSSHLRERGSRISPQEMSHYYGHADPVIMGSNGTSVYTLVQPMLNQQQCTSCHPPQKKVLGLLQVSLSLEPMRRQLSTLKRWAGLATLATLGVIIAGIWLSLTYLVDHPLHQLVEVMERAKLGDLSARTATRKTDEIGKVAGHFNDMISKLQSAQHELEMYHREQLARADRLATIGEMAAAIAHEIRNPLTGISGVLSVLSRDFPEGDPRRQIVRETHQLIDRLNKSVENILHYSRPSPPQLQRVSLDEIVDRTLALLTTEARKARVDVVKDPVAPDGAGARPTVDADSHQLHQVLMNLTLNAIQATPAGGSVHVRTYAGGGDGGDYAGIEIEDSGKGMSRDEAKKAFQPFFTSKAQGTGLGLPIAKQIVEQHGGRIELISTPGKGTRVKVELPASPAVDVGGS